jgi:hypothetical protein
LWIAADAKREDIEALVAQSLKRSESSACLSTRSTAIESPAWKPKGIHPLALWQAGGQPIY